MSAILHLAPLTADWPIRERLRLIVRVWMHDARKWYRKIARRRRLKHWRPVQVVTQTIIQQPQYIVGRGVAQIPDGCYEWYDSNYSSADLIASQRRAEAYWASINERTDGMIQ